jgi:hypothetical protein
MALSQIANQCGQPCCRCNGYKQILVSGDQVANGGNQESSGFLFWRHSEKLRVQRNDLMIPAAVISCAAPDDGMLPYLSRPSPTIFPSKLSCQMTKSTW